MKEIQLTNGQIVLVDEEDFIYLTEITWGQNRGYGVTYVLVNCKPKRFYMHKMVMRAGKGQIVDHINGNKLDNRKENLRLVTHQQNCMNQNIAINNSTGYKGVSYHKGHQKYGASIRINNRLVHLGYFKNPFDAALAYNEAALMYFGKYARLN
jgi:hypothetical protein